MAIRLLALLALSAILLRAEPGPDTAFLPTEGPGVTYTIDKTTPLPDLIKRLDSWQFIETGKAYLIGYTNDMFSIAAHGDDALPLLRDYIKTAPNAHAKSGAIFTMYLIGIDSQPRDDSFSDPAARDAILAELDDPDCTSTCLMFLIRDAWRSDIPTLLATLEHNNPNDWVIVDGLVHHYAIAGLPVGQPIPKAVLDQQVFVPEGRFKKIPDYPLNVIKFLCDVQPTEFKMDPALLAGIQPNGAAWGPDHTAPIRSLLNYFDIPPNNNPPLRAMHVWQNAYKFEYYVKDGVVLFCTPQMAKQRIHDWDLLNPGQLTINKAEQARKLALLQKNVAQVRDLNRQIDAIKGLDNGLQFAVLPDGTISKNQLSPQFLASDNKFEKLLSEKRKLLAQRQALGL